MTRPKRPKAKRKQIRLSVTICAYCEEMAACRLCDANEPGYMDQVREHIEACPKHPLAKALKRVRLLEARLKKAGCK